MKMILIGALSIQGIVVIVDLIMGAEAGYFNACALWQETLSLVSLTAKPRLPYIFLQKNYSGIAFPVAWLFFGSASLFISYLINTIFRRIK